jgi:hypothetical protein
MLLGTQHLVMLPWAFHNQARFGRFAFLPPTDGVNLLQGYQPDMPNGERSWNDVLGRPDPHADFGKDQFDINDQARRVVLPWLAEHPGTVVRRYLANLRVFLGAEVAIVQWVFDAKGFTPPDPPVESLPGEHPLKHHLRLLRGIMKDAWILLLLFAGLGVMCLWKDGRQGRGLPQSRVALFVLCGVALYLLLLTCVYHVSDRYRWPVEDALFPLAACSFAAASELLVRGRRRGRPTLAVSAPDPPHLSDPSHCTTSPVVP